MHIIGDLDKWISYFPAATVSLIPVCRGNELAEPWNLAWDTYIIHHSEQLVTLIYLFSKWHHHFVVMQFWAKTIFNFDQRQGPCLTTEN